MPPPPVEEDNVDKESWLVTYADAVTLLLAFFVMLLTFAEFDIPAYEEAVAAIKEEVGHEAEATSPTSLLKIDIEDVVLGMEANQVVTVYKDRKGIVIELDGNAFFRSGGAQVREQAKPVLAKMAKTIAAPRYDHYLIEVSGHTDDDPISTEKFPSNWELSAARASQVVRLFSDNGLDSRRMKATGYAATRPKVPNRNAEGEPIPENQAINRRVTVRVYPMSLDQREEYAKLLETESTLGNN